MILFRTFTGEIDRGNCLSNGYTPALLSFFLVCYINGEIMVKKIAHKKGDVIGSCVFIKDTTNINYVRKALFRCKCGNEFEARISNIRTGNTNTCGCFKGTSKESIYKTEGFGRHWLAKRYRSILDRCYAKECDSYKRYGARGIRVYSGWHNDFNAFYRYVINLPDASVDLTIDRIDNNGNYEPGNLRWSNRHIQAVNRRPRRNYEYTGVYKKDEGVFKSGITVFQNTIHLGTFKNEYDALQARNKYIVDNGLTEYKIQKYNERRDKSTHTAMV